MKKYILIIFYSFLNVILTAQTVGLTKYNSQTELDYVLFSPNGDTNTFLIDRCGELVHKWASVYRPGMSTYLLSNGNLMRAGKLTNTFFSNAGGGGGIIEIYDWNGNLIWDYVISDSLQYQHHDIEFLPNGNILAITWDRKTLLEADMEGRDTNTVDGKFWSEKIVEIQPNYSNNTGTIIWEWYLWDHLIQDFDNTKNNYGIVSDFPELININFPITIQPKFDWAHINGIDYNESLDQIVLSAHSFSEFWIIDHSTTTTEAATHAGGNSGKGGDILYRWGNPMAYQRGSVANQLLFKQHDVNWIDDSLMDAGKLITFNNQVGKNAVGGDYSAVEIITPPVDGNGNYTLLSAQSYGPIASSYTYLANPPSSFYGQLISGANRIENGHTLICEGPSGRFFEINQSDSIVWEYVNPMSNLGMLTQGNIPQNNAVFRCAGYSANYSGLLGQTLISLGPLELNPTPSICNTTALEEIVFNRDLLIYPNPAKNSFAINFGSLEEKGEVKIYNMFGDVVYTGWIKGSMTIKINSFKKGVYLVKVVSENNYYQNKLVIE